MCRGHILNVMSDSLFDLYSECNEWLTFRSILQREVCQGIIEKIGDKTRYMKKIQLVRNFLSQISIFLKMVDERLVIWQFCKLERIFSHFVLDRDTIVSDFNINYITQLCLNRAKWLRILSSSRNCSITGLSSIILKNIEIWGKKFLSGCIFFMYLVSNFCITP